MNHKTRLVAAIALVAALASGCDANTDADRGPEQDDGASAFAGLAPAEQVEAARTAMADLRAVHLTGTLTNDGRPLDVDLALADDGSCTGTLGVDGGTAEVRTVDGGAWFRPDVTIWESIAEGDGERIAEAVGERWVVLEDDDLRALCDFRSIMGSLISRPEDGRQYTADGSEEVDGARALRIRSEGVGGTSYGYVREDAPHYLVRTERREGPAPATMTFSGFDEVPDVTAPAPGDVVDPTELDALVG